MATAIDPADLRELTDLCKKNGIHLPANIRDTDQLIRDLLTAHKTKSAVLAIQRKREDKKRLANQRERGGNPDSVQMSVAGDEDGQPFDQAARARALVDASERFHRNPNFARDPFAN